MVSWVRLKRSKIKVFGEKTKVLMKGMTASEEHTHFLQGMLTNDVKSLKPGTFNYNLWLRQNGQPVGDFFVYRFEDHFLLDTELPSSFVIEEFQKLKLSLRVYFEDITEGTDHIFLFGEGSKEFVKESFGFELKDFEFRDLGDLFVAKNSIRLKAEGYDLIGDLSKVDLPKDSEVSEEEFEDLRIRNCVPKIGKELREGFSPLEAGVLSYGISMTKGCYVGQEAVARVYYRGRTPRVLVRLVPEGEVSEGEEILSGGKKVGVVTSVSKDKRVALGYILRSSLGSDLRTEKGTALKAEVCGET